MFVEQLPIPGPNPGDLFAFSPCSPYDKSLQYELLPPG